jgi:hypothetical protein
MIPPTVAEAAPAAAPADEPVAFTFDDVEDEVRPAVVKNGQKSRAATS